MTSGKSRANVRVYVSVAIICRRKLDLDIHGAPGSAQMINPGQDKNGLGHTKKIHISKWSAAVYCLRSVYINILGTSICMMETRIVLHDMQASGEMRPEQGKGPTFFRDGSCWQVDGCGRGRVRICNRVPATHTHRVIIRHMYYVRPV